MVQRRMLALTRPFRVRAGRISSPPWASPPISGYPRLAIVGADTDNSRSPWAGRSRGRRPGGPMRDW